MFDILVPLPMDEDEKSEVQHFVTPGDIITEDTGFMRFVENIYYIFQNLFIYHGDR